MIFEIETSQYSTKTLEQIAKETADEKVLAQLAKSENGAVILAVIANEFTTQELRDKIYKSCNHLVWVVRELLEWQLSTETIHNIVENLCPKNIDLWHVAGQPNISADDLKALFTIFTTVNVPWDKVRNKSNALELLANNDNADEELLQKLVEYSEDTAVWVVKRHRKFIRVDFSKRQAE